MAWMPAIVFFYLIFAPGSPGHAFTDGQRAVSRRSSAFEKPAADDLNRHIRSTSPCPPDIDSVTDGSVFTPLQQAAQKGDLVEVKHLIEDCGAGVEVVGSIGSNALHEAAYYGQDRVVSYLIDSGADPNKKKTDGTTAFHLVMLAHDPMPVVRVLLARGANVDVKARNGGFHGTPMEWAALNNKQDVVSFLKDYKPPAQSNPGDGDSLGTAACLNKALKNVQAEEVHRVLQAERSFTELLNLLRGLLEQCNLHHLLDLTQ